MVTCARHREERKDTCRIDEDGVRTLLANVCDPEIPVLIFEIKASGRMGQVRKSETDGWFERAHDAIIDCFVGVTSRDIQIKYWNRVEETE